MKTYIIAFILLLIFSSCSKQLYDTTYYHIEPNKEWELTFILNHDSTFVVEDKFGCNKFKFTGIWHEYNLNGYECFILNDTSVWNYDNGRKLYSIKKQGVNFILADDDNRFEFIKQDTVCYTGANKFMFRGMPFQKQTIFSPKDLGKQRAKMIRDEFVFKFGKQKFIEIFGEGRSLKKALDNLNKTDCNHR